MIGLLLLAVLLAAAALLQYRWINRASEADLLERRQSLNGALAGIKGELSGAVQELIPMFRPAPEVPRGVPLESHLLRLYSQWQSVANRPQLLGSVYLGETANGHSTFSQLDGRARKFTPQPWPAALGFYQEVLDKQLRLPGGGLAYFPRGMAFELMGSRPLLIFPLVETGGEPGDWPPAALPPPRNQGPPPPPPPADDSPRRLRDLMIPTTDRPPGAPVLRGWCFLELNSEYLKSQLLPGLVERIFGAAGLGNYQLAVVGGDGPEMIYQSDAELTLDALRQVDAGTVILGQETLSRIGPPPEGPPANGARPPPPDDGTPRRGGPPRRAEDNRQPRPAPSPRPPRRPEDEFRADASPGNSWRLVARHRAGSLDAEVGQTRRRNLALNFGILLLLGGSIAMIVLAAQRARRLARQQMEFVASITHELRTPLSVIHSASYNLASGVVSQPGRVQDYGAMIQNEARRLAAQVEQALSFAGIEANRRQYDLQPVRLSEIVERAMNECAPAFAEAGWQVEYEKDEPAPVVLADAPALESAVKNLLHNALKYADSGKQLRVAVRAHRNGKRNEAQITIADRGPGVAAKDLPHLFEPFYRGEAVRGSRAAGAGLGLSIVQKHVEAHHGRVSVASNNGATFTIHLPAVSGASG
ncbi:MAG TPA: HAMP domain-containing sensor histidine kinase [Blastocatellia bacterium]|nr:HAMP domain-containing sensor histidine kinase [Blastocatellia bacterium]